MCIDLKLHKKNNAFANGPPDVAAEAYYCFATCYKNEKGLSMNLSRPTILLDSAIEINILRPPNTKSDFLDNFRIYLELAQVQSRITTDLRRAKEGSRRAGLVEDILLKLNQIWQLNIEVCLIYLCFTSAVLIISNQRIVTTSDDTKKGTEV